MKTHYRHILSRRSVLRGAGGVVLGLPFLEEMTPTTLYAQAPSAPARAFNVFFGLGYQKALQEEGLTNGEALSPLQPLVEQFGDRLAFLRGVDQSLCNGVGNSHFDGAAGAFTGTPADHISKSKNVTGGASIDQALRAFAHPDQLPLGVLRAIDTGSWWRFSDSTQRYLHSRLPDGTPAGAATPPQDPVELFRVLFGAAPAPLPRSADGSIDPADLRELALRRSVLDALSEQYRHFSSPAGGLGAASRERIKNHFEQVRGLELEVAGALGETGAPTRAVLSACVPPEPPGTVWAPHRRADDATGIQLTVQQFTQEIQLMARLFALGVACDRIRFGSFVVLSAGERIQLTGDYHYQDELVATFADQETSHEYWHRDELDRCRPHLHLVFAQIAYLLEQLDQIEEGEQRVLDTALLTIATESGQGRHVNGELRDVLHIFGSAGGRVRVGSGDFLDVTTSGVELYNTLLAAHGVPAAQRLWDGHGDVSQILL